MRQRNLALLLANLASRQTESETPAELDAGRMSDAILGRRPLSEKEIAALWSSPSLRAEFLDIRRTVIGRFRSRWNASAFGAPATLRAASSEETVTTVQGEGWFVEIVRLGEGTWAISLGLSSAARSFLPALAELQLADDGGLVWGHGRVDDRGALDFEWDHPETPLARLRSHRLAVDLV